MLTLYGYPLSSAAYRVRIALALKGMPVEHSALPLRLNAQRSEQYLKINPFGLVPTLEHNNRHFWQSLAIIEYLEEIQPSPHLLPRPTRDRAFVRALAQSIACDIHPLNNLRVLRYLKDELGVDSQRRDQWYAHWVSTGLSALESVLSTDRRVGTFCYGESPGLVDICLVPQVYNAERVKLDLSAFPTIARIVAAARELPAFQVADPERQPDAE
jgi:maleylpyruvate isomerase